ncbi:HAMP domain-containing histidine kinase [Faecalicatena sp. AGMB00832]|uniref:histidine kinase n=1 Tax=Faecalicatena faecalis TaxID=2726362 RepID=A0ABS6D7W4_9FIRM|nr:HAMP domain-containing sensor histidine kinase [Faecalicatena faecalis]MBU3877272.1 HAMP domain-containing histidine kinase [Faecalicatena faecalis]
MGWIRRMSLKKSLFMLTCISVFCAAVLSILVIMTCIELKSTVAPQGVIIENGTGQISVLPAPTEEGLLTVRLLEVLQIGLPVLIFVGSSFMTAVLFYRVKLKESVAMLADGANCIIANDLDFTIEAKSDDELGRLCTAFETMRQTLLENNRRLWKQSEEQKRLNAAFSHELRNPITVLKGSVKLVRQGMKNEKAKPEQIVENLVRIEEYTDRIEEYVETMSSVQRLEQISLNLKKIEWNQLTLELEDAVRLIGSDSEKQIYFEAAEVVQILSVDPSILMQIVGNLVSNALRFAEQTIRITCNVKDTYLEITVRDDGAGFPLSLIRNGILPFQKGSEEAGHFGMGLYISSLLCQKHGGHLEIYNTPTGAEAKAMIKTE